MSNKVNQIPNIIEARNFKRLRALMAKNNYKLGGKVLYEIKPPAYKGAKWYATFYEEIDATEILKQQLEELK